MLKHTTIQPGPCVVRNCRRDGQNLAILTSKLRLVLNIKYFKLESENGED